MTPDRTRTRGSWTAPGRACGATACSGRPATTWSTPRFTAVLVGVALWGFRTDFFGCRWILAAVGGLLLGLLVTHVVTAFRLPSVVTLLGRRRGLPPARRAARGARRPRRRGASRRGQTFRDLADTAVHGWKRLVTLLPPVDATVDACSPCRCIVGLRRRGRHLHRGSPRRSPVCRAASPPLAAARPGASCSAPSNRPSLVAPGRGLRRAAASAG